MVRGQRIRQLQWTHMITILRTYLTETTATTTKNMVGTASLTMSSTLTLCARPMRVRE